MDYKNGIHNELVIPSFPGIEIIDPKVLFYDSNDIFNEDLNVNQPDKQENNYEVKTSFKFKEIPDKFNNKFLTSCLNDILSVNTDVIIYKVEFLDGYTLGDCEYQDELIIYSNKKLNTKYFENKKSKSLDGWSCTENKIIEDTQEILSCNQTWLENTVPVSLLFEIFSKYVQNINKDKQEIESILIKIVRNILEQMGESYNYYSPSLTFYPTNNTVEVYLPKKGIGGKTFEYSIDDDNNIKPTNNFNSEGIAIFKEIRNVLASYFKFCIDNKLLLSASSLSHTISLTNAYYQICLENNKMILRFMSDNETILSIFYDTEDIKKYQYQFESYPLVELVLVENNLQTLLENTFVKIEDCPDFIKEELIKANNITNSTYKSFDSNLVETGESFKQKIKSLFTRRKD